MCSERSLGSAYSERPVDRLEPCYCPVPESVQVILKRIQILSFEASMGVGPNAAKCSPFMLRFQKRTARQPKWAR
jgi:hypothetical protein